MSQPEERVPDVASGTEVTPQQVTEGDAALSAASDPGAGAAFDPEVAEEYAESVGVDPTPDQIDEYLSLEGAAPLGSEAPPLEDAPAQPLNGAPAQDSAGSNQDGPVDAQAYDPEHARSELAGETPPQADAEAMESALRERGRPLAGDPYARARRVAPTEEGPGTSLT